MDDRPGPLQSAAARVSRPGHREYSFPGRCIRDQPRSGSDYRDHLQRPHRCGHVPLILGGVYLAGPPPVFSASLWMVVAVSSSFVFARLRLEAGSVWPAVALHASWNSVIQIAFDPASTGAEVTLWVGESGILVTLTMIVAAVIFARGRWAVSRLQEGPK